MIELTSEEWEIVRKVSDSLKIYPNMQLIEYSQNKEYDYKKQTCCSYELALDLKHLVAKKGI